MYLGSCNGFTLANVSRNQEIFNSSFLQHIEKILVAALHIFLSSQNICFCSETQNSNTFICIGFLNEWWRSDMQRTLGPPFTSLMADLRQDINKVSSFSRYLNGIFPWRNCSVKILLHLTKNDKSNKYKSSLLTLS